MTISSTMRRHAARHAFWRRARRLEFARAYVAVAAGTTLLAFTLR